ncbi:MULTISPECIES: glycoside hydrolase family 16 protein [Rhizobium]|uniref:Beta-glucanase n=1 Tax=Rhizobium favelukesii TaxID=348824 RepID=W6RXD2_9HYPH|nr:MULTISPECIES: glycoside hydrolase family 16 protein [Rhizobium]MCS0461490.1 glycoside hydrolase family 16 protein [Rhizobium favelukesii]UFS83500.1 glycoside hydrolase family 16 protein [Rhizobium sp. T136]CDM58906.1 glycoside hydrolase family protein [Rhizobium favelukesii]
MTTQIAHARKLCLSLLTITAACVSALPASAQQAPGKSFVDDFDKINRGFWYVSDGWNNGAHQNCTWSKNQVKVEDGALQLSFADGKSKDRNYLCGEIQTTKRYSYGTYEARIKAGTGSGLNSAFFTYIGPADKQKHDEIDFEVLGKNTGEVQVNQYVQAKGDNEKLVPVGSKADEGFNDYAFIWEKDRLRYYLNGKLVQDVTDPSKIPSNPQKIFFSLWGSDTLSNWMGRFDYTKPAVLSVDRVAFTALGDKCQFPESIACTLN